MKEGNAGGRNAEGRYAGGRIVGVGRQAGEERSRRWYLRAALKSAFFLAGGILLRIQTNKHKKVEEGGGKKEGRKINEGRWEKIKEGEGR
jgi:hypothetical protein